MALKKKKKLEIVDLLETNYTKNIFDLSLIIFKSKTKIDCGKMKFFALKV